MDQYLDRLWNFLDVEKIASKNFRVIIDPCNGAGAGLIDRFCEKLSVRLVPINNEPTGIFPHDPEPRPRNASQIASIIKPVNGDIGFLLNSDVSRVSIVSDTGETVTEEYTFPLVAEHVLSRSGPIVANFSSFMVITPRALREHKAMGLMTSPFWAFFYSSILRFLSRPHKVGSLLTGQKRPSH